MAERLLELAQRDYLTGLANRRGLYEYFEQLDQNQTIHAMFIDVDNFKSVNDVYGHSMGDELLVQIAHLIADNTNGFVSRIGGDEYVVIFEEMLTQGQMETIAEALLSKMKELKFRKDILSYVSLSVGIVMEQSVGVSLDEILAKCDGAMYQAKFNGKNCYAVYKADDKSIEISKNIELEMEKALEEGQFQVYLQPKVNMVTSALYGAEALSRWVHPIDGVRTPSIYIPVFEKNGFIAQLDMYIFEEACRIKQSWKGKKYEHIPISVNVSRLHLYNPRFPELLEQVAQKYQIPTEELELEITEGVFVRDNKELIRMVDLLEQRGFMVSIDDFGSGFSALNLLKDIPVNTIKLDKEFMRLSSDDIKGRKVIRNVIAMCKDLKLDVVTEGIETKEQVDLVTSCGCQIAQGYYYARPLPLKEFELFAEEYSANPLERFTFRLNGNLQSEDGSFRGKISGEGLSFVEGIYKDCLAMHFPGGEAEQNTVHIPTKTIVNDSFTISLWIRPSVNKMWSSALYIKFESGFCSVIPLAWEGNSDFRIRDSREVNGWYDLSGCQLREGEWAHYVISYNARTETAIAFINGEVVSRLENVPTNHFVKWIILGGDVFQPSFEGDICELMIYNEPKDYDFVKQLHQEYVTREDFIGFPVEI